jgi:hypothetical protein
MSSRCSNRCGSQELQRDAIGARSAELGPAVISGGRFYLESFDGRAGPVVYLG